MAIKTSISLRSKINKLDLQFTIKYFLKSLDIYSNKKLIAPRNATISPLYDCGLSYTSQGRVLVKVPLTTSRTGFKFGMFAATKKPFNFRPKKKKQKR